MSTAVFHFHGMYSPSEGCIENNIGQVAHVELISETGETIRDANLVEDFAMQLKKERSLTMEMKAKLFNALSTRKNASRNRSVSLVGYLVLQKTATATDIVLKVQRSGYHYERRRFPKNVFVDIERSGND